jgi:hypothetical protein
VGQESGRHFMHLRIIHEEAVQHAQAAEIAGARQPRAFYRDDAIIIARDERVVAAILNTPSRSPSAQRPRRL